MTVWKRHHNILFHGSVTCPNAIGTYSTCLRQWLFRCLPPTRTQAAVKQNEASSNTSKAPFKDDMSLFHSAQQIHIRCPVADRMMITVNIQILYLEVFVCVEGHFLTAIILVNPTQNWAFCLLASDPHWGSSQFELKWVIQNLEEHSTPLFKTWTMRIWHFCLTCKGCRQTDRQNASSIPFGGTDRNWLPHNSEHRTVDIQW